MISINEAFYNNP